MMNQKEGVFGAVIAVVGEVNGAISLSTDQKNAVHATVFAGIKAGEISYKGTVPDDKALMKYVGGLVNNWTRKDTRLNGGGKYQTKSPGIRSGSGDAGLKAMRQLLATQTDPAARTQIQSAIDQRIAELKPKVEMNLAALPPELRHFASAAE